MAEFYIILSCQKLKDCNSKNDIDRKFICNVCSQIVNKILRTNSIPKLTSITNLSEISYFQEKNVSTKFLIDFINKVKLTHQI